MLKRNRKIIFGVVCSVFLIMTPLIITISLGYNFDSGKLRNSLQVKVETYPINAKTYLNNLILDTNTPTDITITQSGQSKIDITKEGYLDETFWVNSRLGQNLNTRLTQLKLLQSKGKVIATTNPNQKSIAIADNNLIWQEKEAETYKFYIQKFNAKQLTAQPAQIEPVNQLPTELKTDLNLQIIGSETFFDKENQLIIYLSKDNWKVLNLANNLAPDTFPINKIAKDIDQVVSILQDVLLIRDKQDNLWELNLSEPKSPKITLRDQKIKYLYYDIKSKNCWFLTEDKLYKINGTRFSTQNNLLYLQSPNLLTDQNARPDYLSVSNFIQGVIIQVNNNLYYYNDSSKNNLSVISNNADKVINYTVFEDTLFWITNPKDSQISIQSWNFNTNYQSRLGIFNTYNNKQPSYNDITLDYSSRWFRLLIFQKELVSSSWYDKSSVNHNISSYSLIPWITSQCSAKITEQNIFCLFDSGTDKGQSQLQVYENNNLF